MRNIEKYYDNTKDANPNYTVRKFIELRIKPGNAVELGCGAGRDTVFLIKNGWNVFAIDREDIELKENNLVVANFSFPYCNKNDFKKLWNKIDCSILKDGYFGGNFFGNNDEWKYKKNEMFFLTKEQVIELFKNFEIVEFKEVGKDSFTGLGKMKHWHIFNVIAKKL